MYLNRFTPYNAQGLNRCRLFFKGILWVEIDVVTNRNFIDESLIQKSLKLIENPKLIQKLV